MLKSEESKNLMARFKDSFISQQKLQIEKFKKNCIELEAKG